ncbi:hypothetical protein CfE428DRAFT_5960 [Chthoniobacter flavus Ellin428]|uniref:Uncharacterized protein n=1 Tax=Chthoniobacter flavus Ellin428 TaxID=497964 RepID=B4DAL9_9BACT|nr:hypothetical protein [Chthoniobacter flavus]EDY16537.1 hypothetical protein CfE428DRAFT_5960 [Chthoniobacter flavus Ellin428]
MKNTRHYFAFLLPVLFWIVSSVMAIAANTVVDFENVPVASGTTFTNGGQTWSLTGKMETVLSTDFGSPAVGTSTPESKGYIDTGLGSSPLGSVGGIKAPTGFHFPRGEF